MNFSFTRDRQRPLRRTSTPSADSLASERRSSPEDTNWETLDLSSTGYARVRKEMMQLIDDLRALGAETMMDLPSIVVIGCQSAGKSSLVEAVSGLNVPRDSGTCTRCPMECTMSSSATTWSCKIKLRFDYDSSGRFSLQQKEIPFGPTLTDKSEVDIWLRRAQAAILNPDITPESFHRRSAEDLKDLSSRNSLKFSRNVVSIFIEDPSATDLSFVDLPGLIQNEDEEVVDLVRELTESYINRQNAIILTTIPMSDDMQNQLSVKLARQVDPDGERTIGVLTKPDILGDGAVNSRRFWLDVIEGRHHELRHGYYCVRLPDDAQRAEHLSRSAFQRIAAEFFSTTAPWSEVADRGRFGIPAFVTDISVLLVSHIKKVIPQLKEDVERLLASCLEEIGTLPQPLQADPQIEVLARVNAFCDAFKGAVLGTNSDKSLAQRNRALYTIFARDLRGTSPDFRPFDSPTEYKQVDTLDFEGHAEVRNSKVKTMGVYDVRKVILESIAWELPGNLPYEAKARLINQSTSLWSTPAQKCLGSVNDVLDDVIQQLAEAHFGRFRVLQNMISDLIRPDIEEYKLKARAAVKETLDLETCQIYTGNQKDFEDLRQKWLTKYRSARRNPEEYRIRLPRPSLEQEAFIVPSSAPNTLNADGLLDPLGSRPSSPSLGIVERTIEPPVFWSTSVSVNRAAEILPTPEPAPASQVRVNGPVPNRPARKAGQSAESQALHYLAQAGYRGLTVTDLVRLSPRDQFEDELVVMADVRAYFTIAYKRVIDHVPLNIQQTLHRALAERLSVTLFQRLLVDAATTGSFADRMKELVKEDPVLAERRARLETTRVRLQEMKRKLVNFAA